MYNYGTNSGQSSARPVPSRLQTQSYQQQRANRYSSETLSPQFTPKISSLRLPSGSSFNFFSVISKFEALDALSPPYKESRRGASPLQAHITSATPRGRTQARIQSNCAGILSPRGESRDRGLAAVEGHGSHFNTQDHYAKSSYNKSYILERQSPDSPGPYYKSSGSRPQHGLPSETPGALGRRWVPQDVRKMEERKTHLGSIRDIISYFDGAADATGHNEAIPHPTEAPKTPLSQMQSTNKDTFSLLSTLSSQRKVTPRGIQFDTPTNHSPLAVQKKRNFVFAQTTPSPSVQSSSAPKLWTKAASPNMVHKNDLATDQRGRPLERSPARSSKASHPPVSSRMRGGVIERNEISTNPRDQSARKSFLSREYEKVCGTNQKNMGETPYLQQSLERKRGFSKEPGEFRSSGKQISPRFERPRYETNISQDKTSTTCKQESKSKVARMKSLFERASSSKEVPKIVDGSLPEPNAIPSILRRPAPNTVDPAPVPVPSNFRSTEFNPIVSPKPVPISAKVSISKTVFPPKSYMRNDQSWTAKSRIAVGDEMRYLQSPQDSMSTLPQQPNHSLTRPTLQTTNNSTHRPLLQITNSTQKHSLSARDIQDMYNEFQDAEKATRAKKRKTFIEKWNFKLPGPPTPAAEYEGAEDFVSLSSSSGTDMSGEVMVVKEADCGLREPKPLRITEMKRMMLLCRGRAGVLTAENKAKHKL